MTLRKCCYRAREGLAPPCEPCQNLMQSDAFSGVDARNDDYPLDRDPYELAMEGHDTRRVEAR